MYKNYFREGNRLRYLVPLLFIWIPVANAVDVPIPELGVVLNGYPDDRPKPSPVERPDGFMVALGLGRAQLTIYRYDDSSRAAIPVSDKDFQKDESRKREKMGQKISGAVLAKIGGQDAWLIKASQKFPIGGVVGYMARAILIVDHQLLTLTVNAMGNPKVPDDFQSALNLLMAVTFAPVDRSAVPVPTLAKDAPGKMPRFVEEARVFDFYPAMAKRLGLQGAVDVQFNIDGQGKAQNVKITHADYSELSVGILSFLNAGHFRIPTDWLESGSQMLPFTIEYQFAAASGSGAECTFGESPAHVEGAQVVRVCSHLAAP